MADLMVRFFSNIVSNPYVLIALLSIFPITELKGSILYAANIGINPFLGWLICCLASSIVIPVLLYIFPKLLELAKKVKPLKRFLSIFVDRLEKKAGKMIDKMIADNQNEYKDKLMIGVFIFVALPLPLTGVWAGTVLACIIGLDIKRSIFALFLGNLTSGGLVTAISMLFFTNINVIFSGFIYFALAVVFVYTVFHFIKMIVKKKLATKK